MPTRAYILPYFFILTERKSWMIAARIGQSKVLSPSTQTNGALAIHAKVQVSREPLMSSKGTAKIRLPFSRS